jgi:hypothetical protein
MFKGRPFPSHTETTEVAEGTTGQTWNSCESYFNAMLCDLVLKGSEIVSEAPVIRGAQRGRKAGTVFTP